VHQNIMQDTGSASRLQGVQKQLEHQFRVDRVGHLLEQRADLDQLHHLNILAEDHGKVAPALQGPQRSLRKNLAKSRLFHALRVRPSIHELEQRGLFHAHAPATDTSVGLENTSIDRKQQVPSQVAKSSSADNPSLFPYRDAAVSASAAFVPDLSVPSNQRSEEQKPIDVPLQRRSKNFHLTRILLKFVAQMAEAHEISTQQKATLKDLICDQNPYLLAVAETFDGDNELSEFKDALVRLSNSTTSSGSAARVIGRSSAGSSSREGVDAAHSGREKVMQSR